jgi:hypothetical protein
VSQTFQLKNVFWFSNWKRLLGPTAGVVLAGAAIFSLTRTAGKTAADYQIHDFGAYYRAAGAVVRGENPYVIDEYGPTAAFVYSPAFAYLLSPLIYLDYVWAWRLWMLGNWAVCVACLLLAFHLVAPKEGNRWALLWLGTLPLASFYWNNINAGQVGALMLALCLGWRFCQRQGRSFVGGILLAMAAGLKIAPALLVPYLLVRRDWRGLAGFLTGGLALILVPAPWTGLERAWGLHLDWARHCQNTQIEIQTCRIENQSLLGALARLPGVDLHLLQQVYPLMVLVLAGAVYLWIIWSRRSVSQNSLRVAGLIPAVRLPAAGINPAARQSDDKDNLHLSLLFILMTLVHPRAWTCNFVGLTLACYFLADRVCRRLAKVLPSGA